MIAVQRRKLLYEYLMEKGSVQVAELCQLLSMSEETIRRDLKVLEQEGVLTRTYGGAYLEDGLHQVLPASVRERVHTSEKQAIAAVCAEMIQPGATIFLDGSTTCQCIATEILKKRNLIVITNSIHVMQIVSGAEEIEIYGLGGRLRPKTLTFAGSSARKSLDACLADFAFIGCDGVDVELGVFDAHEEECAIRAGMLQRAQKAYLVADNSKFGRKAFQKIADVKEFYGIITDAGLSEDQKTLFLNKKHPLILAYV